MHILAATSCDQTNLVPERTSDELGREGNDACEAVPRALAPPSQQVLRAQRQGDRRSAGSGSQRRNVAGAALSARHGSCGGSELVQGNRKGTVIKIASEGG